jgi:pimeloyl-ACP methyl ester carboxylesterase
MPKLRTNGIDLYCEVTGKGQPLLFIHGLGDSTQTWEKQVAFFSRNYEVVTFDVRGHGQSDKPAGPYSIPLFAEDTAGLLRSLRIAPAHVVGLSLGGMIAFQLAVSEPGLLRTMTIVNSGPAMILRTFRQRYEIWRRLFLIRVLGMKAMGNFLGERLFPKPEQAELRRLVAERIAQNDKRAYLDSTRALVGWSVAEHLGSISCPTLVISADQDYTPVPLKEAYVAKMPRAELVVIKDSRHVTHMDQPEEFNKVLLAFLSSNA